MSFFKDPMAPQVPGVLGMSNVAAQMSNEGLAPRVGGPAPASPWAPPQLPSFMQQQQPQAPAAGFWPSWLSPSPGPGAQQPAPAAPAAAGPNMGIPGAAQAMMGGAPSWALQMLFGGYT